MPDFSPRRAEERQEFGYTDDDGNQRTMRADKNGLVRPRNAQEHEILNSFDLPVARKTSTTKDEPEQPVEQPGEPATVTDTVGPGRPDADKE